MRQSHLRVSQSSGSHLVHPKKAILNKSCRPVFNQTEQPAKPKLTKAKRRDASGSVTTYLGRASNRSPCGQVTHMPRKGHTSIREVAESILSAPLHPQIWGQRYLHTAKHDLGQVVSKCQPLRENAWFETADELAELGRPCQARSIVLPRRVFLASESTLTGTWATRQKHREFQ